MKETLFRIMLVTAPFVLMAFFYLLLT